MKMIVWKAPPFLVPLLRRVFARRGKKQKKEYLK